MGRLGARWHCAVTGEGLLLRLHHEGAEPFPLRRASAGKFLPEFLTIHPPNNDLIHSKGHLWSERTRESFKSLPGCSSIENDRTASSGRNTEHGPLEVAPFVWTACSLT